MRRCHPTICYRVRNIDRYSERPVSARSRRSLRLTTCPIAGAQLTAGTTVKHSAPLPACGWLRRSRSTAQARELGEFPRPHRQHGTTAITLRKREASIVTGKHFKLRGQALERRLELGKRLAR